MSTRAKTAARIGAATLFFAGSMWMLLLIANAQSPATTPDPGMASPPVASATAPTPAPAPVAAPTVDPPSSTVAVPGPISGAVTIPTPPDPGPPPVTVDDWAKEYRDLRSAYHTGLLALAVAIVFLLARLSRTAIAGRLLDRLPANRRWIVPAAIGVLLIVLPEIAAGVSWWRALIDGGLAAFAAIGAHSAIVRDLLGFPSPSKTQAP